MPTLHFGPPLLHRSIPIPEAFLTTTTIDGHALTYGGDVRIGDLTGDGQVDFLVFRSVDEGMKPCFLGAFDLNGCPRWQVGNGGDQPARPGPVAIHDIDGDGRNEVICFFLNPDVSGPVDSMSNVVVQIRDGATGAVKKQASPGILQACQGSGPNWVHQRILIANLRGNPTPRDFIIKLGEMLLAFDDDLRLLWSYAIRWNEYSRCTAYIPAVGDIDGDGCDEVTGGYYLLDHDGTPLWEKHLAQHMDSVAITEWDDGQVRVICSGGGHVVDAEGQTVLCLGEAVVPHGQEVRVADFLADSRGPEMVLRYRGHTPEVMVVNTHGDVLYRFQLNDSPNFTGMEAVYWGGPDAAALLYNGGMLWHATGEPFAPLPGLPQLVGSERMGWYHCIPANVCGDEREEVVLYNPWDRFVHVYTPMPFDADAFTAYHPSPRQYNPRLMD